MRHQMRTCDHNNHVALRHMDIENPIYRHGECRYHSDCSKLFSCINNIITRINKQATHITYAVCVHKNVSPDIFDKIIEFVKIPLHKENKSARLKTWGLSPPYTKNLPRCGLAHPPPRQITLRQIFECDMSKPHLPKKNNKHKHKHKHKH
jgi:hypothetical protein